MLHLTEAHGLVQMESRASRSNLLLHLLVVLLALAFAVLIAALTVGIAAAVVTLALGIQEAQTLAVRGRPKWIQKYIWQQQNHTASP